MNNNKYLISFLLSLLCIIPIQCQNKNGLPDWPEFRGIDNAGIWHTELQIETLSPDHIKKLWEIPLKPGYSGPTVSDQKVFVMDYDRETSSEMVKCFHAETGEKLWEYAYERIYSGVGYPTGPRASVLINENMAFSLGTMGDLYCFEAGSGKVKWYKNTLETYKNRIPIWGLATSPIIEGDLVIVQIGGLPDACVVAFNKYTGEEIWKSLPDEASYSTPIIINQGKKRVLLVWTGDHIVGINPATGHVYWKIPYERKKMIMNVASPVYDPPYLFLSSFFDGSFLLKLNQEKPDAELIWHRSGESERKTDALHSTISTPIIKDGYIYGVDSYGEVRCLELLSGNRVWEDLSLVRHGRWSNIHFVLQGDKTWAFNETGELILGEFSPEKFRNLGRVKLIDPVRISPNPRNGVCWAHPAFYQNKIIVRNDEKMICYEVVK